MPSLSKSEYNQAIDALEKRKDKVPLNTFWSSIHKEYAIGQVQGKYLALKLEDRDLLKSLIQADTGSSEPIDPNHIASRIDASEFFIDEKWTSDATILSSTIQIRSLNGPLVFEGAQFEIPPTTFLSTDYQRISPNDYHSIVVVENLEAFLCIEKFVLPDSIGHSLVLFRGYDNAAKAAQAFLSTLSNHQQVIAFMDADPAGINIALSTSSVTHWLVPQKIQTLEKRSHRERFHKQASRYLNQIHSLPPLSDSATNYINTIMTSHLAIPQEYLIASQHPTEIISIEAG